MTTTATLSALLRTPNEVIDRLDEGDLVLTRRDGESLRLTKEATPPTNTKWFPRSPT